MPDIKPILYTSPLSTAHDTGEGHPESAERMGVLEELFAGTPFKDWPHKQSSPAALEQILLAHDEDYVFGLQDKVPDHGLTYIDGDTVMSPQSYDAALHAAGAVCHAVDDIFGNDEGSQKAFIAVRPPGHHAEPNTALGFCFFNNVFIGARHAQQEYGVQKIAILDFDVHHGNGTETMTRRHNASETDAPILYISSHGYPLFPMTGEPDLNDETTLNVRLPDGCGSDQFRKIYEAQILPTLRAFAPELIMLSSGFDAHKDDPLAPINLETADYGWLTEQLCKIADETAKGRIVSVLEGGYHIEALRDSIAVHLKALATQKT